MGAKVSYYILYDSCEPSDLWCAVYRNVTLKRRIGALERGRQFSCCVVDLSSSGFASIMSERAANRPLLTIPIDVVLGTSLSAVEDSMEEDEEQLDSDSEGEAGCKRACIIMDDDEGGEAAT